MFHKSVADIGPKLARFGRICARWVQLAKTWSNSDTHRPTLHNFGRSRANVGLNCATCGDHIYNELGQDLAGHISAQIRRGVRYIPPKRPESEQDYLDPRGTLARPSGGKTCSWENERVDPGSTWVSGSGCLETEENHSVFLAPRYQVDGCLRWPPRTFG